MFTQNIPSSQRIFWGNGVDQFYNAKILQSGKVILLGRTDSHRNGGYQNKDGWAVMLSSNGDTLWSKSYGGRSRTDRFWDVEEMENGNLLFVGSSGSFLGSENVYVVQTDSTGKLLRSFNYGEMGFDTAEDIELTLDGGWIMIGKSKLGKQESDNPFNMILIRCDSTGKTIWTKQIESEEDSYGMKTLILLKNNIYALGNVKINERSHITLRSYNLNGELNFAKIYKGTSVKGESSTDMILSQNKTIYISGYTTDSLFSGLLMELDLQGNVKNSHIYRSKKDLEFLRLVQMPDSSFWTVGYCTEDTSSCGGALLKLGKDYEVLKSYSFRPLNNDTYFSTIRITTNNHLFLVGSNTDWYGPQRGGYMVVMEQEKDNFPYQSKLSVISQKYPLKKLNNHFKETTIDGWFPAQSLEIPVRIEDLPITK